MAFTPIWGTGFEMGTLPMRAGIASFGIACHINYDNVHTGSYSMRVGSSFFEDQMRVTVNNLSTVYIATWLKVSTNGRLEIRINGTGMKLYPSGANWYLIRISDGVTLASGTAAVTLSDYHNLQIMVSPTKIETMVNGNLDISYNGTFGAVTSIDFFGVGNAGGEGGWYDDISIGTGGWPGDIRYDVLIPDGDTAVHGWVPSGISLQAPPAAPTVGVAAGPGLTGDYRYKMTLVDTDGETLAGSASALVQPANQVVALTGIPTGLEGTTARKIYRTAAGGSVYKLVATIGDNTTTSYNDSLADGSLGADEPANVHYDKIDERPASDADFIYTATNGAQDIHTLSDWDATKKVPLYVVQWARLWKDTADTQQAKLLLKSGISSTLRTSTAHDLVTAAAYEYEIHTTDPDGAAWTNAEIDALQAGVEAVVP